MSQVDRWNGMKNPEITGEKVNSNISNNNIKNILGILDFVKNIEKLEKYSDFVILKDKINKFIIEIFNEKLLGKNNDFVEAFKFGNIGLYSLDTEGNYRGEYNELFKLLIDKNKFYLDIFSKLLTAGIFSEILEKNEINDSYHIIESGILQYSDEIYYNWYQSSIEEEHQEKDENNNLKIKTEDGNPIYGGLKNGKFVGYNEFIEKRELKTHLLKYIKNPDLKQYFTSVIAFLESGATNYHSWVGIDDIAIKTWQNREGNLGLITPIENYIHKALVEPEFILFLKNKSQNNRFNIEEIISLSKEFYGESYGMEKVTLNIVETFLEGGQSTVSGFIGKNSPNDKEQSDRLGSYILLKDSNVLDSINHALPLFEKILKRDSLLDKSKTYDEIMKHLVYHEFGHNLFVKGNKESKREEAKASLYYYAELLRENKQEKYNKDKIQLVVESALIMWFRDVVRLSNPSAQKHVLRGKVILDNLFLSGLISFNGDKLEIIPDESNFSGFLTLCKTDLDDIQNSYTNFDIKKEEKYIKELEERIGDKVNKMLEIIKK